jgi:hypothetical protein
VVIGEVVFKAGDAAAVVVTLDEPVLAIPRWPLAKTEGSSDVLTPC